MYLADISATSLDELEVCAWCARLSIAGLGCGGNGLTFGGNPGRNWVDFALRIWRCGVDLCGLLMDFVRILYGKRRSSLWE
jgi:hypothetical protein